MILLFVSLLGMTGSKERMRVTQHRLTQVIVGNLKDLTPTLLFVSLSVKIAFLKQWALVRNPFPISSEGIQWGRGASV